MSCPKQPKTRKFREKKPLPQRPLLSTFVNFNIINISILLPENPVLFSSKTGLMRDGPKWTFVKLLLSTSKTYVLFYR